MLGYMTPEQEYSSSIQTKDVTKRFMLIEDFE